MGYVLRILCGTIWGCCGALFGHIVGYHAVGGALELSERVYGARLLLLRSHQRINQVGGMLCDRGLTVGYCVMVGGYFVSIFGGPCGVV